MKKNGFTLVELLAVIVILAIILVIAVPSISNMIDSVKFEAFNKNEQMMIKAAKNYIATDESSLPINVGDTKEIKLSYLQTNNYISTIKDPKNSSVTCDGYVLITKKASTIYDYTPNLKCGDGLIANGYTNDGLVAYWKLDGDAYDYSPNDRRGTITGATSGVSRFNISDKALIFDGVNDTILLGASNSILPTNNSWTISLWFKANTIGSTDYPNRIITLMRSDTYSTGISILVGLNNKVRLMYSDALSNHRYLDCTITVGTWYHYTATYNGTTYIAYLNGINTAQINDTFLGLSTGAAGIGAMPDLNYPFNGSIDDIKIYNRVLSASEIKFSYNIDKSISR